jgi:MEMO1 family protein
MRVLLVCVLLIAASVCANPPDPVVRPSALSGTWYAADAATLRKDVEGYLDAGKASRLDGTVRALIAPHAGYRYSGTVAGHAYAKVRGKPFRRVVILAPSHHVGFRGISIPKVTHYETPLGRVPLDLEARDHLLATKGFVNRPDAHTREHALEIQLPFLQVALGEFTLVPLVMGSPARASYPDLANAIRPLLDETTLLVASSDFTHYGTRFRYTPFIEDIAENLRKLDLGIADRIVARDLPGFWKTLDETKATVCGRRAIGLMLHLLGPDAKGTRLRYETSGSRTEDFKTSVSYVSLAFAVEEGFTLAEKEKRTLLRLARATLEEHFASGKTPDLSGYEVTPRLKEKRGAFVTLKKGGRLRGCVGYIVGRLPLAETIVANAINAGFRDRRFPTLKKQELADLHIEISVMSPLKLVTDPLREIEVGRHGILMRKDGRQGVFLPQVPVEQGWDLKAYLENICYKAGIRDKNAWKRGAVFHTFEAIVFGEKEE